MIGFRATVWHAALFAAGVFAIDRVARDAGKNADPGFYDAVKRPRWSPPAWTYGPIWTALNAAQAWGDLRLLRRRSRKSAMLALQAVSWLSFLGYTPMFFRLRSPRLALATRIVHAASTVASIVLARRVDSKAALALAPTAAWLGYALPVSGWIAARNADPFLHQSALR